MARRGHVAKATAAGKGVVKLRGARVELDEGELNRKGSGVRVRRRRMGVVESKTVRNWAETRDEKEQNAYTGR